MKRAFVKPLMVGLLVASFSIVFAQNTELMKAKSFKVEETIGKSAHITVEVMKPDNILVKLTNNKGGEGMLVCDGSGAHEYYSHSNTWKALELAQDGHYPSTLLDLGAVDVLMAGGKLPQIPDGETTTTHESYNGQNAIVTTELGPARKGRDGKMYQFELKLWSAAATGMPLRRTQASASEGKESIFQDLSFDDIKLNPSVEIAWKAPNGSKEDTGPAYLASGTQAPNFALKDADGKTVSLSDYKGKVVILDFWATWCGPCQRAMPHLQKVFQDVKDKDVVVLGVCVWDEKKAYDQWVQDKKGTYTFQTLFDPAGRGKDSIASKYFEVQAIPTQYVIGKDGKIVKGYIPGYTKVDPLIAALKTVGVDVAAK